MNASAIRIGTAGWAIPRAVAGAFPGEGSTLERYGARFDAAEINSTFYRSHRPATWTRWAAAAPPGFRCAVKLARSITHEARLAGTQALLDAFIAEVAQLGETLGPMLVQLPPSLAFDADVAEPFLAALRARWSGQIACEPRHESWFEPRAEAMLAAWRVARVAADPARRPQAARPGGWRGFRYWRLHGSPRMYRSSYDEAALSALAAAVRADTAGETWVIFDNTASGAAAADALRLQAILGGQTDARGGS